MKKEKSPGELEKDKDNLRVQRGQWILVSI